jgi:hypothetical protein
MVMNNHFYISRTEEKTLGNQRISEPDRANILGKGPKTRSG